MHTIQQTRKTQNESNTVGTHVQTFHVPQQTEVLPIHQRFVVEVGLYVVRNAHHKGAQIIELVVQQQQVPEELELDHVTVMTERRARGDKRERQGTHECVHQQ